MNEIKGSKAGSGKQKKPVIAPDSAQSKTYIKQQFGLGEGEIEGPVNGNQSVLLNETAVEDANGNQNFEGLTVDFRNGTNDQTYMEGFPEVSNETEIQVELKTQWVQSFSDINIDALRIRLKWGALTKTNDSNGNVDGITIKYAIDLSTDGGSYVEVLNTQISDKTSNGYERTHRIELPIASSGWNIRVRRLTPVSTDPYVTDDMYIASYAEVVDAKFRYPNTALLGLQYDAENFSGVAKVAVELKGLKIRVPSNYDPVTRTYLGVWNGSFKRAYSNNPAWIYYDICTAERYGLGDRITDTMLDKASLYRLAQYCDGLVSDGAGGLEPRFTCNVYIQKTEEAYAILSKIAGVFRAISYWDGDSIICDADIPQDVFYNYTNANVIGGLFEYSGTRARDRHTIVKVAWDNPANNYKTEYEIVRDENAIAKFGIRPLDLESWGCTSRGQAQRTGLWALRSEQYETQTVTFKVGLDGQIPVPGKVVSVADNDFAGRFIGGRISSISSDRKTLTLDREIQAIPDDLIYVNTEQGQAITKTITAVLGKTVTVSAAYTNNQVAAQNAFTIDSTTLKTRKFRVMSVKQDDEHQFSITALEYNALKFDSIDSGAYIEESPVSIINPKLQDPVTDVELTTYDQVQQGISIATMIIGWTKANFATKYLVEWRKDDGTWIKMPIIGNTSVEVQGIYSGNYEARVTAISAFDIASLATYSILTPLLGKQGKPPKLAAISATGILFGMRLNWLFPAIGALDTAYTEIEVSPDGVSNIAQLGLFAYPTSTHTIQGLQPNLTQKYRGRLIDRIGNIGDFSEWATGTTSADAAAVLDLLNEKITETQLHQDLRTEIEKIPGLDDAFARVSEQVTEIEYDQHLLAQTVQTVQTAVGENVASIQEVTESVDGLYAQKFIKIGVGNKVAGWGGANNGVESQFIFNFDSIAIGSGNSTAYYPFIFRSTAYTDPVSGTVFPIGAYLKAAFIDYASIDTAHIKLLAVKSANIENLAVTEGKIADLAVTTLKIQNEAVTVPSGVSVDNPHSQTAKFSPYTNSSDFVGDLNIQLSRWEAHIGAVASITTSRSGGKASISASVSISSGGQYSLGVQTSPGGGSTSEAVRRFTAFIASVYRNGALIGRAYLPPTLVSGAIGVAFDGQVNIVAAIDQSNTVGIATYELKVGFACISPSVTAAIHCAYTDAFKLTKANLSVMELKK